jgi:hypothetical protein
MEARRRDARWPARRLGRAAMVLSAITVLGAGCVIPGTEESTNATIDVERDNRQDGDVEAQVGDTIEVYGITATVVEVGRVDAYNELDNSGYIWARVQVENGTNREVNFHRRHFRLEKPDGNVSNTANISTESQIEGGTSARSNVLRPGETREGQVIYTAGDLEGQFALLYIPESPSSDPLDRQRGVWVFESSPDDAE